MINYKNNSIYVIDDIIEQTHLNGLYETVIENMEFGKVGTDNEQFQFWDYKAKNQSVDYYVSLIDHQLKKIINKKISLIFYHFNGTFFGNVTGVHYDDAYDSGNVMSALLYLNPYWDHYWEGGTIFYNDFDADKYVMKNNIDHIKNIDVVFPKPGRCCLFDALKVHNAGPISKECPETRVILSMRYNVYN